MPCRMGGLSMTTLVKVAAKRRHFPTGCGTRAGQAACSDSAWMPGLALLGIAAGSAYAARPLMARMNRGSGASSLAMALSASCLAATLAIDVQDWWQAGLRGDASG